MVALRRTRALRQHEAAVDRSAMRALDQLRSVIAQAYDKSTGFLDGALLDNRNPKWRKAVEDSVMPSISSAFGEGFRETVLDRALLSPDPFVGQHLATVRNRVVGVADTVFGDIRGELETGRRLGESIPDLSKRIDASLARGGAFNWAGRATTIARTEVISAYNVGATLAAEELASVMEVDEYQKEWLATGDARTRPTHMDADGQKVWGDQTFDVGGEALEEPGDPAGSAEEVINCRCTVLFHYPGDPDFDETLGKEGTTTPEEPVAEPEMPNYNEMVAQEWEAHPDWNETQVQKAALTRFAAGVSKYHDDVASWEAANWARTTEAFYRGHTVDDALTGKWYAAAREANPNYGKGPQFGINCQNTVTAFDMRMRGYNVAAQGNAVRGGLGNQYMTRWLAPEDVIMGGGIRGRMMSVTGTEAGGGYRATDVERIVKTMTTASDKPQWGVVYTGWRDGDAHVFNWVRAPDGAIQFLEPQAGRNYGGTASMWSKMDPGTVRVVRLDDLPRPNGQGVEWRD